jgi:formylglycine-generating enzyme required for sulfatase activity
MKPIQAILLIVVAMVAVTGCTAGETLPEPAIATISETPIEPTREADHTPSLGDTRTRSIDGAIMVYVPTGEFEMGSNEKEVDFALQLCMEYDTNCRRTYFSVEQPVHTVFLDDFWIDKTEVTNNQYGQCVNAGVCSELGCEGELLLGNGEHPAICMTWDQAAAYCKWVEGRLPTEAEWEYAARGPEGRRYPWGNDFDGTLLNYCDVNCLLDKRDETFDDGYTRSAPVGSYPGGASWVGALDLAGNVWEFVADRYGSYSRDAQTNPTGPSSGHRRVARGGSWHTSPDHVRSALRTNIGGDQYIDHAGFRCVQSIP